MSRFAAIALSLALSSCAALPDWGAEPPPPAPTLADLPAVELPAASEPLPQLSTAELTAVYQRALDANRDPELDRQLRHRLADLQMQQAEEEVDVAVASGFNEPIAAYKQLLAQEPGHQNNDAVLYQLSRALELNGDNAASMAVLEQLAQEHPQSVHVAEAEFRKAESYFIAGDYERAEVAYGRVVAPDQHSSYRNNALYMQGWSRFKLANYQQSVVPFSLLLDALLPAGRRLDTLPRGERELVADSLRVMAVAFSYLGGAQSIADTYAVLGERHYEDRIYLQLGDLYLAQERYRDSAETYRLYTEQHPDSRVAHEMQLRVVQAYEAGGFEAEVLAEKAQYVSDYAVGERYWRSSRPPAREQMTPLLQSYLVELANYHHGRAQLPKAEDKAADYRQAAEYYQQYIDGFPRDERVPELAFLMGEARFEAGDYAAAVAAYENMGYRYRDHPKAADAAYAALLAWERLTTLDATKAPERTRAELRFTATFASDARAPAVQGHAADSLLARGEYRAAVHAARTLTEWQPVPGADLLVPAWLVVAHGEFELQRYSAAEQAYGQALATMPAEDSRRSSTTESLAASVYRQGEQLAQQGRYGLAAAEMARVLVLAPDTQVRVSAQYDAAGYHERDGNWQAANELLADFRHRYPQHELSAAVGPRLVKNFEQLGQWQPAAAELDRMRAAADDPQVQREALLLAADYYHRADDIDTAIVRYREYAHQWPQPHSPRMEAMNALSDLYAQIQESEKQAFWQRKLVAAHDEAGESANARSLYLAARAATGLAESADAKFYRLELRAPLQQSLPAKNKAMQRALAAWEQSNRYGVAEFSTLATYRMAELYRRLASELMASERPAGLEALALEQYELLLEEQAYPFEEQAIAIHERNAQRSWQGVYDRWVAASFSALELLQPARYHKPLVLLPDAAAQPNPRLQLALASGARGEWELAEHWFTASVAADADLASYQHYAAFLSSQGRFDEAEAVHLGALEDYDDIALSHRNIGVFYELYRGDPVRALNHFKRCNELLPEADRNVAGWIADLQRRVRSAKEAS